MSDHVVYVDRFQLREGKLEDFKRYATKMAELAETNEPGVVSFTSIWPAQVPGGIRALECHRYRALGGPERPGY
jgi:hypothetical protein